MFLFALVCYHSLKRESCFHCRYGFMMLQTITNIMNVAFIMEKVPVVPFILAFGLLALVIVVRHHNKEERKQ